MSGGSRSPIRSARPSRTRPARGEHDGTPFGPCIELGKPGVHVATDVYDPKVGPGVEKLRPATKAARCDHRRSGKVGPSKWGPANESISRILSRADRRDDDSRGELGWQILEGVNREIDPVFQEGVVNLLGKQSPASDPGQRHIRGQIAGGFDLDSVGLVP